MDEQGSHASDEFRRSVDMPAAQQRPILRIPVADAALPGMKPPPFKEIVIEFLPPSAAPTGVLMLLL